MSAPHLSPGRKGHLVRPPGPGRSTVASSPAQTTSDARGETAGSTARLVSVRQCTQTRFILTDLELLGLILRASLQLHVCGLLVNPLMRVLITITILKVSLKQQTQHNPLQRETRDSTHTQYVLDTLVS